MNVATLSSSFRSNALRLMLACSFCFVLAFEGGLLTPQVAGASGSKHETNVSIVNGRFTKTVEIQNGVLTISPPPTSYHPSRTFAQVTTEAWSTEQLGRADAIGLGVVTISQTFKGAATVHHLIAWVGLTDVNWFDLFCPYESHASDVVPKWQGEEIVIVGDAPGSADVVFDASSNICGRLSPPRAFNADELFSVPWKLSDGHLVAQVPACSIFAHAYFHAATPMRFGYFVAQRESPASAVALPPGCQPKRWIIVTNVRQAPLLGSTTIHDRVGPVVSVYSCNSKRGGELPQPFACQIPPLADTH
jgi:hypothetical protein